MTALAPPPAAQAVPPPAAARPGRQGRLPSNPFDEDRLNDSADFHADWDVPSLNADASAWLVELVREVKSNPGVSPARKIAVLLAQAGYGKTHLFGRVADALGRDVAFAFVGPIFEAQLERPLQHVRWHVVETLFEPPSPGEPSWVTQVLARLCQPSFRSYFDGLPDLIRTRFQALRDRLGDDPLAAAMEILSPVAELAPYQRLADSLADAFPSLQSDVVRALALGWSPAGLEARRWLRGDDLPGPECERLGLGADAPEPERVMEAVAMLLQRLSIPLVVCCDQLEAVLKQPEVGPVHLSNGLVGLLGSVPNLLIVLGCHEEPWDTVLQGNLHQMFLQRTHPPVRLKTLSDEQSVDLVRRRLERWEGNGGKGGTWPIRVGSVVEFARRRPQPPRALVQACKAAMDDWIARGEDVEVNVGGGEAGPSPEDAFVRHWNQELEKVKQKAKTPEDRQEAELFQAVHEALRIARDAKHLPAGVELLEVKEGVIPKGGKDDRPSLGMRLAAGGKTFSVVVGVSKKNSGVSFGAYVAALGKAVEAAGVAGAVLVRPHAEIGVGPAAEARKAYEKLVGEGKLRPFALEQEQATYDHLECLLSVLTDADDGLPLGGKVLSRQDCVGMIVKEGLLKSLKLFNFVFDNWAPAGGQAAPPTARPATAAGLASPASQPAGAAPSAAAPGHPPGGPTSPPPAAAATPAAKPAPHPVATPNPPDDLTPWAEGMLAQIVEKLLKFNLPVRPLGVQIGPTFARLKLLPSDKTDINKVRNKAGQLWVSLGLPARPLIGFQPGFISVDVQLPRRQTVALAPLLAARPAALKGQAAFPAGLDVAGQAHWLNLADAANCHLLIAGTTGSGKSEFLKVILASLAHGHAPERLQFILIDPKRVTFNLSGPSPYLRHPIAYEHEAALPLIEECVGEMERRYELLAARHKSNVSELTGADAVPRVVLVFDEFADLMADKAARQELEPLLKRLGAKARASGIHLVLGTQRTEASVVTPLLRSNLPGRVSLRVASDKDSALILDAPGAADLLGKGDLLWRQGGDLLRLQSPFVANDELEKLLRVG